MNEMPFIAYNTDDPNAASQGYVNVGASGVVTIGPLLTNAYTKVLGSFYCDQAGQLQIQQSFDYFVNMATAQINPTPHWDVVQFAVGLTTPGTTVAATAYTIDSDCVAPVVQVVYTNGATPTNHIRLFVRLVGLGARG